MRNLVPVKLNGMNNRARPEALPENKARNAVNVLFGNDGEILFPRPGSTSVYVGDCKWLHEGQHITLFVENGVMKLLNPDYSATNLYFGIGSGRVFYTVVGDDTYWANPLASGIVNSAGINREWGTARPPRQPDCTAVPYGGMFGGEYRVVITWLGSTGEESGTGAGIRITVPEGGGIHAANFPVPPSHVTGVAIYISSVNGKYTHLYGEFSANILDINLTKKISTIPLTTQFMVPPKPVGKIYLHMGRIYYAVGSQVYFTEPHRYGLRKAFNFFSFDSEVQVIVSTPPTLYVGTLKRIYRITNIDSPDGTAPQLDQLQLCSSVLGSECSDPLGTIAYCMTERGFIKFTADGLQELTYSNVAIPHFDYGTSLVTESNGLKYLTFCGQGATANPLVNTEYAISEALRGTL